MTFTSATTRSLGFATFALLSIACGGTDIGEGPDVVITPRVTGAPTVSVALASASLGDDCSTAQSDTMKGAACTSDAINCGSCQQSSIAIKLSAGAGSGTLAMQVSSVRIFDDAGNNELGVLTAREPSKWTGTIFTAWNEQIAPLDDYVVNYKLSSPDWSTISPSGFAYSATYRVVVEVVVGGQHRTISLTGISRAPILTT